MEQHSYSDEESPLFTILPMIQRLVYSSLDHKSFPYSRSQIIILIVLSIRKELTMKEVAGYLSSSKEQATRAISPLVDEGLVERFENPANRVHVYVRLTDSGVRYLKNIADTVKVSVKKRLQESISPESMEDLENTLFHAIEILREVR